uniref:Uncharacterized protein n=1 Tax=Setaria viridis TaxID=4556 RepID=A0A4U6VBH7_SETVI|nr:hypothetical protein SEVIR_4G167201v2 [Setaria viridis]
MASLSKRKVMVPSKSKTAAAAGTTQAVAAVAGAAATKVPRGSGSALAPNLVSLSNSATAAFVGRGSSSSPTTNPSASSIHPQSMADSFDSPPIHGRQGYPIGFGVVCTAIIFSSY